VYTSYEYYYLTRVKLANHSFYPSWLQTKTGEGSNKRNIYNGERKSMLNSYFPLGRDTHIHNAFQQKYVSK
jgi:hypothetical protein